MKKYCKNVDITNIDFIKHALYDCFDGKYNRHNTMEFLADTAGLPVNYLYVIKYRYGKTYMRQFMNLAAEDIRQEIINRDLTLQPIHYYQKIDKGSGKTRNIGVQDIKQQVCDYIAVYGLKDLMRRIGEYQCGVIKPRGQIFVAKRIKKWFQNRKIKYAVKLDIRKCYESIDRELLMKFLRQHVRNDRLLWLINRLIYTFDSGVSIGSYLSQYLCVIYLSQLYHEIAENMYRTRITKNGEIKRTNLIWHIIFYCDDILLLGTNKNDMHDAIQRIIKYTKDEMNLDIKSNWYINKIQNIEKDFVDMVGYKIYRDRITIRKHTFRKIRRAFKLAWKFINTHKLSITLARKCISYLGLVIHTDSQHFIRKFHVDEIVRCSKKKIGINDRTWIYIENNWKGLMAP